MVIFILETSIGLLIYHWPDIIAALTACLITLNRHVSACLK